METWARPQLVTSSVAASSLLKDASVRHEGRREGTALQHVQDKDTTHIQTVLAPQAHRQPYDPYAEGKNISI